MNERKQVDMVRHAVDMSLSGLQGDPWLAQRLLANAKGEEKVKKKISAGLVLAVALILIAVGGLAAALIYNYFSNYAQIEGTYGSYDQWPGQVKADLIQQMMDSGLNINAEKAKGLFEKALSDDEKEALADEIINEYYQLTDAEGNTAAPYLRYIMEAELGTFGTKEWSSQDMALYSDLSREHGIGVGEDEPLYAHTTGEDISQKEAISLAQQLIMDNYGLSEAQFSRLIPSEAAFIALTPEQEPQWRISYFDESLGDEYDINSYIVELKRDGTPIRVSEPRQRNDIRREFDVLKKERGLFVTWTIEQKYEYVTKCREQLRLFMLENPDSVEMEWTYIAYLLTKQYQLPTADDIAQATAIPAAQDVLTDHSEFAGKRMQDYKIHTSFLVNEFEELVWRVFFIPSKQLDADCGYYVDIDAKTASPLRVVHQISQLQNWAALYE